MDCVPNSKTYELLTKDMEEVNTRIEKLKE
jgi:hypothetical protein